ncbi:MAG: ATP phosphoribosyltransferase [Alphaproteobacteria bacterium]|jgi:ATP phosphoribosyltransferase
MSDPLVLALPKGRLAGDCQPLLEAIGAAPEAAFSDKQDRRLRFHTQSPEIDLIPVKPFDVATFVGFGGAQLGVVGADVLAEFDYSELYVPVDLGFGTCRLSVAGPQASLDAVPLAGRSHLRVATKYPNVTRKHFAAKGIHAECIKLNGAIELGPMLGMASRIVDLVSTGTTLKINGLVEEEVILHSSARLVVNRSALKTDSKRILAWINAFRDAVRETQNRESA